MCDEKGRPVKDIMISFGSDRQAGASRLTDRLGRFLFKGVCPGNLKVTANDFNGRTGQVSTEGGNTNITVRLQLSATNQKR